METDKRVRKYVLNFRDSSTCTLTLPRGAIPIHVGVQYDDICLWAVVDSNAIGDEKRNYIVVGTDQPFPRKDTTYHYVGTVLLQHASLVFHIFEDLE